MQMDNLTQEKWAHVGDLGPFCLCFSRSRWLHERLVPTERPVGNCCGAGVSSHMAPPLLVSALQASVPLLQVHDGPCAPDSLTLDRFPPLPAPGLMLLFFFFFPAFSYAVNYA